jgi:hypothetical protein
MWNLLKKNDERCAGIMDWLEGAARARSSAASVEELCSDLPAAERSHVASCAHCREAAEDILATREVFRNVGSDATMARPWFASRVMSAIAARERELTEVASTWLAVPKFASRLAVVSAALLLMASTWVYQRPLPPANQQTSSLAAQESLFEAPPPASPDDVLVPVQENNP